MFKRNIISSLNGWRVNKNRKPLILRGARQVGKTTSVEQALAEYSGGYTYKLAEGLGLSPLDWLISEWNAARAKAKVEGEYLLVIDEIHKIKGWSAVVKRLWDEDSFNHVELKVCILGSSRLLLQKGLCRRARPANCARIRLLHKSAITARMPDGAPPRLQMPPDP